MAERLGFPRPDPTLIATAISEIARNIVVHAGRGEIVLRPLQEQARYGLCVIARDEGAGIRDIEAALRDDYSARGGLGLGLAGARRLMDEFELASDADHGTNVIMRKWRVRDELDSAAGEASPCVSGGRTVPSSGASPPDAGAGRGTAETSPS